FLRSATLLILLLAIAIGLLLFMNHRGRQDSLLGAGEETLPIKSVKARSRAEVQVPEAQKKHAEPAADKLAMAKPPFANDKLDFQNIMRMIDTGNWREAEVLLQELLQKDPRHEGALVEMAMLNLIDKHDSHAAQPFLERALDVNPDNEAAVLELLGVYEESHGWDQGLAFLRSLPIENRKSGYVDYGIGSALVSMGRSQEAIPSLQKAIYEYGYREYTAREGLAEALVDAGRIDEGIREYQNISEGSYKPNQVRIAKIRIASALMQKQQYIEARNILKPLQESDPRDEWVASLLRDLDSKDTRQRM
ncbi:MAG: tetratricopeptide repeat protein, partial [Proteobacteria bacterium]|nr:tetratricopeptide repeat protein [Pseudomonadota bacterium]